MEMLQKKIKKLHMPKWIHIILIIAVGVLINFYLSYAEENEQYNQAIELSNQGKWSECVSTLISNIPNDVCEKVHLNRCEILYIYANANRCIEEHKYEIALYYLNCIDPSKVKHQFSHEVTELKSKVNLLIKEQDEVYASICPKGGLGDTLEIAQKKLGGEISNGMLVKGANHALASANNNKRIFNINMSFGNKYKVISWEMMDRYIPSDKVFLDKGYDKATELYYCRYTSQSLAEKIPESEGKFILLQMAYGGDITAATGHEID